jgi:hypothetical protein
LAAFQQEVGAGPPWPALPRTPRLWSTHAPPPCFEMTDKPSLGLGLWLELAEGLEGGLTLGLRDGLGLAVGLGDGVGEIPGENPTLKGCAATQLPAGTSACGSSNAHRLALGLTSFSFAGSASHFRHPIGSRWDIWIWRGGLRPSGRGIGHPSYFPQCLNLGSFSTSQLVTQHHQAHDTSKPQGGGGKRRWSPGWSSLALPGIL